MKSIFLTIMILLFHTGFYAQNGLQTCFEQSDGNRTPRYAETIDFCRKLADASPMVQLTSFGKSPQGRDLPVMIVDRDGLTDPESMKASGRVILMIEACIHPGESEGKDAGMLLIRDLIRDPGSGIRDLLDHVSILFIPIFNVDGHERFGPYNRINQNGPEEMGWRVTATNLNLNRDFLKADAPEMKAWLKLYNRWDPDFFIDIHTTDGADYQYVLTYMMETLGEMDPGLTDWCDSIFLPAWIHEMDSTGYPVFPYVEFRRWHDPKSGLVRKVAPPMLSQGYVALRNRPGLLVETHMLKPYKQRVEASYQCLVSTLQILRNQYRELRQLNQAADAFVQSPVFRKVPFVLRFELSYTDSIMAAFNGFSYDTILSTVTGGRWYKYHPVPETFTIPLFAESIPAETIQVPEAYVVPVEWQTVIAILKLHGVQIKELPTDSTIRVTSYKFSDPQWRSSPYEGRHPLTRFGCTPFTEERVFPAGSVIVGTAQPAARVIIQLLEPEGDGSLLSWGFFDAVFEQKEYFELYVMEPMAKQMLGEDPDLRRAFEEQQATDTNWIKNQWQVMNWFLDYTPYADKRKMVYPVGRIEGEGRR
ncbi:MAG: peptidase M14 [Bacteroidetes bacterium]|nr:MAG: peptidase M14 [Bacteroidota bacterium]